MIFDYDLSILSIDKVKICPVQRIISACLAVFFYSISVVGGAAQTPPPGAQAAGYTTLALNIDFTGATASSYNGTTFDAQTLSDWLDCAGASNPIFWEETFVSTIPPCSAYNIINDSDTAVLDLKYSLSYWPTSLTTTIQTANPNDASQVHDFPQGSYYEIEFRQSTNTVDNSCATGQGNNPLCLFASMFTWVADNANPMEWDIVETYSNGAATNGAIDHYDDNWVNMGPNYYDGNGDLTNYHTYAMRMTTNGNNQWAGCTYLDNTFLGCGTGNFSGNQQNDRNFLIPGIGAWSSNNNVLAQMDMYIRHIRVWSCAGWATGQCTGTLLTGAP